jgi:hypothetical protein
MTVTSSPSAAAVPPPQPRLGDRWQSATRAVGGDSALVLRLG